MTSAATLTSQVSTPRLSFKDDITKQVTSNGYPENSSKPADSISKSSETSVRTLNTRDGVGVRQRTEVASTNDLFDDGHQVEESLATSAVTEGNRLEPRIDSKDGYPQVAGVFCIIFVVGGLSLSWGIYIPRIVDDMNTSLAMASFAGGLAMTVRAAVAPWAGSWPGRFGSQRVVAAGGVVISVGLIGSSFATDVWELYVFYGLMVGMGLSLLLFPGSYIIIQWYRKKKATMLGVALASMGIGSFVFNVVAALLINRYGWRGALRITVVMVSALLSIALLLIRDRVPPRKVSTRLDWHLFRDVRFLLVFLSNVCFSFGYAAPFFFTVTWAERHGMSSTVAAIATGFIAISTGLGTPVQGWIGDRTSRDIVFVVCMLCAGAVLFVWPVCKTEWSLLLVSLLYGFATGGQSANTAAIITDWFPRHDPGKVNGLSGAGRAVGELFGPVLIAMLFDTSPEAAFMLSGAFMMFTGISIYVGSIWPMISNGSTLDNVSYTSVTQRRESEEQQGAVDLPMTGISRNSSSSL
eukprot:Clim_evm7s142 gene=Clim_evmTU7s142